MNATNPNVDYERRAMIREAERDALRDELAYVNDELRSLREQAAHMALEAADALARQNRDDAICTCHDCRLERDLRLWVVQLRPSIH
jgi:hypothetical protein